MEVYYHPSCGISKYILLRILEGGDCRAVAYADDVAIIFNGKYPLTLCDLMTA